MAVADLMRMVEGDFKKKYKGAEVEFGFAADRDPLIGLVLDDPLLEYICDRRYLAYGRCYLVYGEKGSSKSTLGYHLLKVVQQKGGVGILIDTENGADLEYIGKQGVDLSKLIFHQTETAEQGFDLALSYAQKMPIAFPEGDTPVIIILDSLAGNATAAEADDAVTLDKVGQPGAHAKLAAKFYRKFTKAIAHEKIIFLATNQERKKIGGMPGFGPPPVALIGGEAQFFNSTLHLEMDKTGDCKWKDQYGAMRVFGSIHRIKCKRNKLGRAGGGQEIPIDFYIDGGADTLSPLVRMLEKNYEGRIVYTNGKVGHALGYTWNVPNCKYIDPETKEERVIDTTAKYTMADMDKLIYSSTDAKEYIRKVFGIPDMITKEEVKKVEEKHKRKRGKKVEEDAEENEQES